MKIQKINPPRNQKNPTKKMLIKDFKIDFSVPEIFSQI